MASFGLIGPDRKPLFNIGRIPGRQSAEPDLPRRRRQILPPGRKGGHGDVRVGDRPFNKPLKLNNIFRKGPVARSLLTGSWKFHHEDRLWSVSRQKHRQACLFRARRSDPPGPIRPNRRPMTALARWSTATPPPAAATTGRKTRRACAGARPRRADDQAPATDSAPRDSNAAADQTARNNADDQNAAASARDNASSNANTDANAAASADADASGRAKAKSASKSDDTKTTSKSKSSAAESSPAKNQPQVKPDAATAAVDAVAYRNSRRLSADRGPCRDNFVRQGHRAACDRRSRDSRHRGDHRPVRRRRRLPPAPTPAASTAAAASAAKTATAPKSIRTPLLPRS